MPSSPKIPKELILEHALQLLIRDGYAALNIKALAKEIGCSTQPISWHFGNMEGLRRELELYALAYANQKMRPSAENAIEAFGQVGNAFIQIAVREPNLFRFLYLEGRSGSTAEHINVLLTDEGNPELVKRISCYLKVSEECAGRYLQDTIIYTHGIATLVATGMIKASEEEMMQLVECAAKAFRLQVCAETEGTLK